MEPEEPRSLASPRGTRAAPAWRPSPSRSRLKYLFQGPAPPPNPNPLLGATAEANYLITMIKASNCSPPFTAVFPPRTLLQLLRKRGANDLGFQRSPEPGAEAPNLRFARAVASSSLPGPPHMLTYGLPDSGTVRPYETQEKGENRTQTLGQIHSFKKTGSLTNAMATPAACDIRREGKERRDL